jgi:hypothetical protein
VYSQVTFHRFIELQRTITWQMIAVSCGAYESAIRDLRFILEDMCQAVYIDQSFGELEAEERYKKAQGKDRLRGSKLICALDLPQDKENQFIKLYTELCDYAHPIYKVLMELFEDFKIAFFYNKEWFSNAQAFHNRTCDAILYLVLRLFPESRSIFFSKPHILQSLRNMSCSLTLSFT